MIKIVFVLAALTAANLLPAQDLFLQNSVRHYWNDWKKSPTPPPFKTKLTPAQLTAETAYLRACLERFAPWIIAESDFIDRSFNWPADTYLTRLYAGVSTNREIPGDECSSWALLPDLTGGRSIIIHKNRDSTSKRIQLISRAIPGKRRWFGLGNFGSIVPTMGFNDRGLVVLMNSGDPTAPAVTSESGMGTPIICRILLERCATAAEAIELLTTIVNSNAYFHHLSGSMWFIADAKQVFVVEHTAHIIVAREVKRGIAIRANAYHYPELQPFSDRSPASMMHQHLREFNVRDMLCRQSYRPNGVITVADCFRAARIDRIKELDKCYPLCGRNTNSAASFVIDLEFPAELSSVYAAFGPPDKVCFIPMPLALTEFPTELCNGKFCNAAIRRAWHKLPYLPPEKTAQLESAMIQRHRNAIETARAMLRQGKSKEDARKILVEAFKQNWQMVTEYHRVFK